MPPLDAETATICERCSANDRNRCIPHLLRLFEYWNMKRGKRKFPSRADIDPSDISQLLPNIYLVDVLDAEPYFRYRLSGTSVDVIHRQNLTGKSPREVKTAEIASLIESHYRAALVERRPRCDHVVLLAKDQTFWHFERLILPLSDNDEVINMLLCGMYETETP